MRIYDARVNGGFFTIPRHLPVRRRTSATAPGPRLRVPPTSSPRCRAATATNRRRPAIGVLPEEQGPQARQVRQEEGPSRAQREGREAWALRSRDAGARARVAGRPGVAAPAQAALEIVDFQTNSSTSLAGGHPDLQTSFDLGGPGEPEVAKNIAVNLPTGVFGNPSVVTQCSSSTSPSTSCPSNSQVGLITVRADYEGDPATCSARRRSTTSTRARGSGALCLHRPDPGHPDPDPGRRAHRQRLRAALHGPGHHPAEPACRRRPHLLGLPRRRNP